MLGTFVTRTRLSKQRSTPTGADQRGQLASGGVAADRQAAVPPDIVGQGDHRRTGLRRLSDADALGQPERWGGREGAGDRAGHQCGRDLVPDVGEEQSGNGGLRCLGGREPGLVTRPWVCGLGSDLRS